MSEIISKAVALLRKLRFAPDDEVYRALVTAGIERQLAMRLVEFLPIAYCRLILAASGARFSNTFRRALPGGFSEEQLLSSEPIWNAAVVFAESEAEQGVPGEDLLAVAARSAEFHAANQLLQKGARLENLTFASPILLAWPEPSAR